MARLSSPKTTDMSQAYSPDVYSLYLTEFIKAVASSFIIILVIYPWVILKEHFMLMNWLYIHCSFFLLRIPLGIFIKCSNKMLYTQKYRKKFPLKYYHSCVSHMSYILLLKQFSKVWPLQVYSENTIFLMLSMHNWQ